jgi:hypothetical protein
MQYAALKWESVWSWLTDCMMVSLMHFVSLMVDIRDRGTCAESAQYTVVADVVYRRINID